MSGPDTTSREPTSGHPRGPGMVVVASVFLRAWQVVVTTNGTMTATTARERDMREKSHEGCALGLMVIAKCTRKTKEIMVVITSVFMAICIVNLSV